MSPKNDLSENSPHDIVESLLGNLDSCDGPSQVMLMRLRVLDPLSKPTHMQLLPLESCYKKFEMIPPVRDNYLPKLPLSSTEIAVCRNPIAFRPLYNFGKIQRSFEELNGFLITGEEICQQTVLLLDELFHSKTLTLLSSMPPLLARCIPKDRYRT